jgi:DNA-binding GntR family transcriptional regulator
MPITKPRGTRGSPGAQRPAPTKVALAPTKAVVTPKKVALAAAKVAPPPVKEPKASGSIVEITAAALRQQIKNGRFAPGQRLIESELCEAFATSRASVREAIARLEAEGLVEVEHQRGARVRRLTAQDAREIYQVREALEGIATRLAAQNIDKSDYKARLLEIEAKFFNEDDQSPGLYLRYNEDFHRLIVEMSENSRLVRMVEQLQLSAFLMLIQAISNPRAAKKSHNEHSLIVDAILKGDGERAERAMRDHIRRTGEEMHSRIVSFFK